MKIDINNPTCICVPCVSIIILTTRENKGSTRGQCAADLFPKVEGSDIFLNNSLSEKVKR